ncbi:MAG: methyltransferase domain-containing protein [Rhodospirillaceae bacterium]|jgi:SAM-dependent methyltransferase|nr:methyltransferase domain-containing protein [Rhodospirillaceae bacterium]MBT4486572.1 methyltransferase domain-containing protein [Rhodospirillaceae bacterium]MBT5193342.1 methyltransferase domain-containing protein [Rhodospirillaceae bacterium]MBT5897598.1 methyltransferase domain-containing protein [Rhodospirillaceae bacterium]MBT6426497.1 methyltransferase domain-containing protein [Rhodospirillaceae bacterium]
MRPDVIDLREFYTTRLGQVARKLLRYRIRQLWPDVSDMDVLALGYPSPYLQQFQGEARRVLAFMPAQQGVHRWPVRDRNQVALVDEMELPLPDASIDRVLLIHGLENAEQAGPLLREIWRVLASGGRLLVVVPNRRGIWARMERTPFGQGHPYSPRQLSRLLRDNLFLPGERASALYIPPVASRMLLRTAGAWENLGHRWGNAFAGVLLMEADKQIYAVPATKRRRRPIALPLPAPPTGAVGLTGAGHHARFDQGNAPLRRSGQKPTFRGRNR